MKEYTVKVDDDKTEWFLNGKLHCENGPAVEYTNGYKAWWVNGNLHREDGPAREYADGLKAWYLNGIKVTEEEVMGVKEMTVAEIEEQLGYSIKIIK